jgi:lipopolysaccharide transport system permease protein
MRIIEAGASHLNYWSILWAKRSLLFYLTRKDLIVRYKQTIVGVTWVLIRPFLTMVVFTMIFGAIANLDSNGLPYGFVVYAGIVPWFLFANLFGETSACLITNGGIMKKLNCPRLIFPIAILSVGLVDFVMSFLLLVGMMFWYKIYPSWQIIFFPLFILMTAATAVGLGLIAATLNAKYRDFQQLVPFILQMGMYLSPVGYLNQLVSPKWEWVYALNPLAGIINGFRWTLVPAAIPIYVPGLIYSIVFSIVILIIGIVVFRSAEAGFADTI